MLEINGLYKSLKEYSMKKNKKRIIKIGIGLLVVFLVVGLDHRMKVVRYQLKGKFDLKIAHITDLHGCYYGDRMQTITKVIHKEQPDIIVYTGDIFDHEVPFDNSIILMEELKDYPSYYVNGNHEFRSKRLDQVEQILKDNNVEILNDRTAVYTKDGNSVYISGIEDPKSRKKLKKQLAKLKLRKNAYNILLAHRPENIKKYLEYDFDLICSGHAHGGQWRIPMLLNGLYAPNQGLIPRYAGGLYQFDKQYFSVSRGLARESTLWVPRFYNRPELVILEISKEN